VQVTLLCCFLQTVSFGKLFGGGGGRRLRKKNRFANTGVIKTSGPKMCTVQGAKRMPGCRHTSRIHSVTGLCDKRSSSSERTKCLPGQRWSPFRSPRSPSVYFLSSSAHYWQNRVRRENTVDMATCYELDGSMFEHRWGQDKRVSALYTLLNQLWGPI
jgi:hypothetical protein